MKYFKHKNTGEYYKEGNDQKRRLNLINGKTYSEYFLPQQYLETDISDIFDEVSEGEFMFNTVKLNDRYNTPMLAKYGSKLTHWDNKNELAAFRYWLENTYPLTMKDIKEGQAFLAWNGDGMPTPFALITDEKPDKMKRPTRLLDGSYYTLQPDTRVCLIDNKTVRAIKDEIKQVYA